MPSDIQTIEYILNCSELKLFPKFSQSLAYSAQLTSVTMTTHTQNKQGKYFCFLHRNRRELLNSYLHPLQRILIFRGDAYVPAIVSQALGTV